VAAGQAVTVRDAENGDIDVLVDRVVADARPELEAAGLSLAPPPPGLQYLLVHVRATYHAGLARRTLEALLLELRWAAVGPSGQPHNADETILLPDRLETFTSVPDGGSLGGNLLFAVEPGAPLYLQVAEAYCASGCDEAWFRLA
jgi:hypothetical protein